MRRRDFLATSLGFAGATSQIGASTAAIAQDGTMLTQQTWLCPPNRFDISVSNTDLFVDCFGPGTPPNTRRPSLSMASVPLARVGVERRAVIWTVASWEQPDPLSQRLLLQADSDPLQAEISFAYDSSGFLERRTVLRHLGGSAEVDLHGTLGFAVVIHEPIRRILYLTGGWTEEAEIRRAHPDDGAITLESRSGKTGFEFQPYAALRTEHATYVCQILWSSNWMLRIEPNENGATLSGGLNDWRFRHRLQAGESLELPTVLFGRFDGSLDVATRHLHDYRRARRPDPDRTIPVQFNSWYPYLGEPTAEVLLPLVPIVKRLGCEALIVDAGWYRTDDGESDADWDQRTGDWRTSRRRFPKGLREISAKCHDEGLRFGLWFEPEVLGPSSSLRHDHPQWLHHIDGKAPSPDERAVLNLGVPAAWQHVFERLTRMLGLIGVDWMKWDFNADLGSGGWAPGLPEALNRQDALVAHYRGLYRLQDAVRAEFPQLILEMCASGGGRMDGAILSHAHVNWMSDQSSALRKLAIHFGTQLAHPAVDCNDWLIDWPGSDNGRLELSALVDWRGDLAFRLHVAMLGTFGISAPIDRWSTWDIETAASHVALYRTKLRPIIHYGDQYYLTRAPRPDAASDWAAIWYAAKDGLSGALFAFRLTGADAARTFRLRGLHRDRRYAISFSSGQTATVSGAALESGLTVTLAEQFRSDLCLVEAAT